MSARILAVDTTTEFGSLALVEDGRVLDELPLHSPSGFAHVLFEHLERLLARRGWELAAIDCFAAAAGPGSFTGVRVGLAAVKGLAEALGRPVAAVSNLRAIASLGVEPLRAALVDARKGEIYGAVYDAALEVVRPETVMRFPAWLEALPSGRLEFLSTDLAPFRPALETGRFRGLPKREVPRALAGAVGRIAALEFAQGRAAGPAAVDANYVRRSDAELYWKE